MTRQPKGCAARWRRSRTMITALRREDGGQSLILVMMIGVLTMVMVGTASTTLLSQIKPTKASLDNGATMAAAQAGLEDFIARVNANCSPSDGFSCPWLDAKPTSTPAVTDVTSSKGTPIKGADNLGNTESFFWKVVYSTPGLARVQSTGQFPTGSNSPKYRTVTLVADVNATPSFNNFEYYTKYETYSSEFVNSFYTPRTVELTSAAKVSGSSLSSQSFPGVLTWTGTCAYNITSSPTCDQNHDTSICDDLYYPRNSGVGRGTDTAWNNSLRRPAASTQSAMGTDSTFAYYSEQGSYKPNSSSTATATPVHNDTCDSSFEPNMIMDGPVYSQDAYLIDRGKDTGNSKNSMPNFNDYAYSLWNGTINGTQQPKDTNNLGWDRAYPGTNGQATTAYTPVPVYTTNELDLPANAVSAKALQTCIYTGPTRIYLSGAFAYITSPATPTGSGSCYQSTGSFSSVHTTDSLGQDPTDSSGGVVNAKVPINRSVIYVQNPDPSVKPTLATPTNPIFNLATTLTVPPNSNATTIAGTWDSSSYSATASCPAPANPTKRRTFDCETGKNSPVPEDVFTNISNAATTLANGSTADASIQSALQTAITAQLASNAVVASAPNTLATGGVKYQVTVGTMTTSSTTTTPGSQTDPLLQSATGGGYIQNAKSWPISITRYSCPTGGPCGGKKQPAITSTQMMTAASALTRTTYTAAAMVNSASHFPWRGTSGYTDPNNDVTQYFHGYGDAYIEGQLTGNLSVVAEHDIVATNDLTYHNSNLTTTTDGLALIAVHNVRIYRPMTCTDPGTAGATAANYCPNDTTGIYSTPLSWPLPNNFPSTKYTASAAPAMSTTGSGNLYGTVFSLRGSFTIDNFYRGAIGAGVNVYGGLYQYHRGATSLPYQGRPYQGSTTKMPGMTLTYKYDNMRAGQTTNGGLRVPWIPNPSGKLTNRTWNVISISTGS